MKAKLAIKYTKKLNPIQRKVLSKAATVFEASEVDVIFNEIQESTSSSVSIEVLEMGTISEVEIKNFLSSLFSDKSLSGIPIELRDDERSFKLPDENEECIDWFIRE